MARTLHQGLLLCSCSRTGRRRVCGAGAPDAIWAYHDGVTFNILDMQYERTLCQMDPSKRIEAQARSDRDM